MTSTTTRRSVLPALALASAVALTACGDSGRTAGVGSSPGGHGGGHSSGAAGRPAGEGSAADVSFLTGMRPHHAQAVEMSDIVLAADPPAEVAALARRIREAQSPEITQMEGMLTALGEPTDGGPHGGHSSGHGGMMGDEELAALRAADGVAAARLFLEAMIRHHEGAIEASDAQIAAGTYPPAVELAKQIASTQAAEIVEMRALLERL